MCNNKVVIYNNVKCKMCNNKVYYIFSFIYVLLKDARQREDARANPITIPLHLRIALSTIIASGANSRRARLMPYLESDEMRLPKKTKWVKRKNERPEGWRTRSGQLRRRGRGGKVGGWCSCLLNGATLRYP